MIQDMSRYMPMRVQFCIWLTLPNLERLVFEAEVQLGIHGKRLTGRSAGSRLFRHQARELIIAPKDVLLPLRVVTCHKAGKKAVNGLGIGVFDNGVGNVLEEDDVMPRRDGYRACSSV